METKKNHKKKCIIFVIFAIVVMITIGFIIKINNERKKDVIPKQMQQGYQINDDGTVDYEYTDELILETQKNMNDYDYIGLSVVETYREFDENGETENFQRTKDIYSEIDLIKKIDYTIDTSKWTGSGDLYELPKKDFFESFGFDYKKYDNSFDIAHALLSANNVSITLESDNINNDDYEEYGQIYYKLDNEVGIIDKLLEGVEYDEIVDKNVHWCIGKDSYRALPVIDYIGASVVYKKDNKNYMKAITYEWYYLEYENTLWNIHIYE